MNDQSSACTGKDPVPAVANHDKASEATNLSSSNLQAQKSSKSIGKSPVPAGHDKPIEAAQINSSHSKSQKSERCASPKVKKKESSKYKQTSSFERWCNEAMFSVGPNYNKLKTNLRLAVNRLKLLGKKKSELAQKSRKEIADFILEHKEDRARIKVEYIVREDYMVEAYELLEMYCDMLLARFGLIQQMKTLDEGLEEAVNSVVWAAPRLLAEVQEFKVISDQMAAKYGKPFVEACRENQFNKVNPKLLQKMSVAAPPKVLVERYMMEIAKSHGVPFTPDPHVIREDEVANAEAMLIDFQNKGQQGYGYQYPPVPPPGDGNPPPFNYPPPPGGYGGGGGGGGAMAYPAAPPQQPFDYSAKPPPAYPQFSDPGPVPAKLLPGNEGSTGGPPSAPQPPPPGFIDLPEVPGDDGSWDTQDSTQPPEAPKPAGGGSENAGQPKDDVDFDDLARRFEELKKKH